MVTLHLEEDKVLVTISDNRPESEHQSVLQVIRHSLRRVLRCVGLSAHSSDCDISISCPYADTGLPSRRDNPAVQERNLHKPVQTKGVNSSQSTCISFEDPLYNEDYQRRVQERL